MSDTIFNPELQNEHTSSKIIAALQRISEAFKVLLWDKAKEFGLSPIQIQILIFVAYHKQALCNVSHLAQEFNITKPTVSDAVKALLNKGHIEKDFSPSDSRSYSIILTSSGKDLIKKTEDFAHPIKANLNEVDETKLQDLFSTLSKVIYKLNQTGILTVQRTCFGCKFYEKKGTTHVCNLLKTELLDSEIRIDCPEFDAKIAG